MKKFLLTLGCYLLPLLALMLWFFLGVDKDLMRGDLGRLSQTMYRIPGSPSSLSIPDCLSICDCPLDSLEGDIVVFGDSFSRPNRRWGNQRWFHWMGCHMGRNVSNYYNPSLSPFEAYLYALQRGLISPRQTIIVETIERNMINRLAYLNPRADTLSIPIVDTSDKHYTFFPGLEHHWQELCEYCRKQAGIENPVLKAHLDGDYFDYQNFLGRKKDDQLLFFNEDIIPHSDWEIQEMHRNIRWLDSLSQSCNIHLYILVIPDKYDIYQTHILHNHYPPQTLLNPDGPLSLYPFIINAKPCLQEAVDQGEKNIFFPDDTHFSVRACEIVGKAVAQQLNLDNPSGNPPVLPD